MPKNTNDIYVVADDREYGGEVADHLTRLEGVHVRVERLPIGDYRVDGEIVFERKTLDDFALSVVDGRLFRQMVRLANSNFQGTLILEGTAKDLTRTGVRREAMQGALVTVSLILGIPVLRSRDTHETANLIVYAARQVRAAVRGALYRPGYRPKGKRKRQSYTWILQASSLLKMQGIKRAAVNFTASA